MLDTPSQVSACGVIVAIGFPSGKEPDESPLSHKAKGLAVSG